MRRYVLAVVMAAALALPVGTAAADPVDNPHVFAIELECDGQDLTIVGPTGRVGHVVDSTSTILAFEETFTGTFTPEGGDPMEVDLVLMEMKGQKVGLQDQLITCTATGTFEEPGVGTFEGTFTAQVLMTP